MTDNIRTLVARLLAESPYAMSREDVLAHIDARRKALLNSTPLPEPDFSPEPLSIVDSPAEFARDFVRDFVQKPKPTAPKRAARPAPKAKETPKQQRARWRIIAGGLSGDNQ